MNGLEYTHTNMRAYVCACKCACLHAYLHVHVFMLICMSMYTFMPARAFANMHILGMYTCMCRPTFENVVEERERNHRLQE